MYYTPTLKIVLYRTRDTATKTISNEQEVDDASALFEIKFNDLSDEVEKRQHNVRGDVIL